MKNHPNRTKVRDWPRYLKEYRDRHGLTQIELANLLQVSARNVQNWEEGLATPPAYLKRALESICESIQ